MARKKYYRKLVRDKIPALLQKEGKEVYGNILTQKKYQKELLRKLSEETKELTRAKLKTEIIEELADVMEVLDAYAMSYGIPRYRVEREQQEKRQRKGGFTRRQYLLATS